MIKKITNTILICLLITLLSGCASHGFGNALLNKILIIDSDALGFNLEYKNDKIAWIPDDIETSFDETAEQTIKLEICDKSYVFDYKDTRFHLIGEKKVHRYVSVENSDDVITVNEDGTISDLLFTFGKIEITASDWPDNISIPLKEKLSKIIDITKYEFTKMYSGEITSEKQYSSADFLLYNAVNGYITDQVSVAVDTYGNIYGLKTYSPDFDADELYIDKTKEKDLISAEVSQLYPDYQIFSEYFTPSVIRYNDDIYIQYYLTIKTENGGTLKKILIPLDLLQTTAE